MKKKISTYYIVFKIWKNLKPLRKYQSIGIILLMFVCAITEIITVSSVVPFLSSLSSSTEPLPIIGFSSISQKLIGLIGHEKGILITAIPLLLFTILNSALGLLTLYSSTNLVSLISHDFSYKAFENKIKQPYLNQILINSSTMISITTTNVNEFLFTLNYIFSLLVGLVISLFLIIYLISISFGVAIILLSISLGVYLLLSFISRKWLYLNSKLAAEYTKKHVKTVRESSGFLREILINHKEREFINYYKKSDKVIRNFHAKHEFIGGFSRYILEALAIIFVLLISYIIISSNQSNLRASQILPLLAAYAFTVQRLLPAMQKVYYGVIGIRARSEYVLDLFKLVENKVNDIDLSLNPKNSIKFEFKKNIEFKNISFGFSNKKSKRKNKLFDSFSLKINKGDHVGIIGPSGSGKSTLIDLFLGFIKPDKGEILIDGINLHKEKNLLYSWCNLISFVPQEIFLGDYSFAENIAFTNDIENIDNQKLIDVSKKVGIDKFINRFPDKYNEKVGDNGVLLSGGQKQRIAIARALFREFDVLILDESTNSLDKESEQYILKNLFNFYKNKTILLLTHEENLLSFCTKVINLNNQ